MNTIVAVIQLIAIFLVPALILRFRNGPVTRLAGPIGTAYLLGMVVALGVWLLNLSGVEFSLNADVGEIGSYVAIGVAIPLLLFGCNLAQVKRLTRPVVLSYSALVVSVVLVAGVTSYVYGHRFQDGRALCAMAIGLYTGGTPNFNAIGMVIGAGADTIALGNLSDMIIGGLFYVFILLLAKPLLRHVLKAPSGELYLSGEGDTVNMDAMADFRLHRGLVRNLLLALGCTLVSAGAGVVVWVIRGGTMTDFLVPAVMIGGTILGIAASFWKPVREVPENTLAGQYLILVFSFALASCLNLSRLSSDFGRIVLLLGIITVGSFLVHMVLCRLLGIDVDCMLVTMTAGLYGPAFVPAVTRQIKNDALTAPGLICGAAGYVIGTFLGVALFYVL